MHPVIFSLDMLGVHSINALRFDPSTICTACWLRSPLNVEHSPSIYRSSSIHNYIHADTLYCMFSKLLGVGPSVLLLLEREGISGETKCNRSSSIHIS